MPEPTAPQAHASAAAAGHEEPPSAARAAPDFAARVQTWQRSCGRHDLPWQGTRDPYRVWLSEVMLQQTQVATVLRYYPRFLQRFADVRALAAAPLAEVLALWSGLGYYSRARHLHRAAQQVVQQHGGRFPSHAAALRTLPGVGRSTAAAIAAFCWGERAAILDGNVRRVLARSHGVGADPASAAGQAQLWRLAEALLPQQDMPSYTQGLMDLGASLCTARAPRCAQCPLAGLCVAHALGQPLAYPVRARRAARGRRSSVWLWLQADSWLWLVPRPPQGIWSGLWSLPEFEDQAAAQTALQGLPGQPWLEPAFVHRLTHLDWSLQPLHWPLPAAARRSAQAQLAALWPLGRWVPMPEALALALPAPLRRLVLARCAQGPAGATGSAAVATRNAAVAAGSAAVAAGSAAVAAHGPAAAGTGPAGTAQGPAPARTAAGARRADRGGWGPSR